MKAKAFFIAAFFGALLIAPKALAAQLAPGESLLRGVTPAGMEYELALANAPDSAAYGEGTRAINEDRWADAVSIFAKVIRQQSEHADGALYWKAYAENKLGKDKPALETCSQLRRDFPSSRWIEECGALEIEIRSKNGQPVQPVTERDENLKLLALNELMRQDEVRAVQVIRELLLSSVSEDLNEKAIFILAHGNSNQAQKLLGQIASGKLDPEHQNPALQAKASALLRDRDGKQEGALLSASANGSGTITLDVVVTNKSGVPVGDLRPEEFKLLDNKQSRSIVSVQAASSMGAKADPPVEVIVLIDAVNAPFRIIAMERQYLAEYFKENGGELALPTSLAIFSDKRIAAQNAPSRNGNALATLLANNSTGLREITRSQGYWGGVERNQLSLQVLDDFAVNAAKRPGRKILIWISPGWPTYPMQTYGMSDKQSEAVFGSITELSTVLRKADITLYSIDPLGVGRNQFYYQEFLKGVDAPRHVDYGDLMLQVLATQSGGQVLFGNNDLAGLIDRCIADAEAYYVLTFTPPPAAHPSEYHAIQVQLTRPGLKARTRSGYYTPPAHNEQPPVAISLHEPTAVTW